MGRLMDAFKGRCEQEMNTQDYHPHTPGRYNVRDTDREVDRDTHPRRGFSRYIEI